MPRAVTAGSPEGEPGRGVVDDRVQEGDFRRFATLRSGDLGGQVGKGECRLHLVGESIPPLRFLAVACLAATVPLQHFKGVDDKPRGYLGQRTLQRMPGRSPLWLATFPAQALHCL